ncbi:MAG: hypothetical protein MI922_04610, partial [Bacteroidales bacterium]|nr:hypothetical protein [Bacteroidales bacterium]
LIKSDLSEFKNQNFDEEIKLLNPSLVVIDSPLTRFSLSIDRLQVPYVIIESMVSLNKERNVPPLNSFYVPNSSILSELICELLWNKYYLKRFLKQKLGYHNFPNKKYFKSITGAKKSDLKNLKFERYFHVGRKDKLEIILSPKAFDFDRSENEDTTYWNAISKIDRNDTLVDYVYEKEFCEIKKKMNSGKSLIYCSFGGMSHRYKNLGRFYKILISVLAEFEGAILVLSIGDYFDRFSLKTGSDNVYIYRRVPQLELLKESSLMITHGGMNTIVECIMYETPMIVFPGSKKIDQIGNSSRVLYHEIGTRADLSRITSSTLKNAIGNIMHSSKYLKNIKRLKKQIVEHGKIYNKKTEEKIEKLCSTQSS